MNIPRPHIRYSNGETLRLLGVVRFPKGRWHCYMPDELFNSWAPFGTGSTPQGAYNHWRLRWIAKQPAELFLPDNLPQPDRRVLMRLRDLLRKRDVGGKVR